MSATVAVPSTVVYCTVIVNELAADRFTMKSAFVVPMFPSITAVS
ncbi:MAG TPA: hypothetical protein VF376_10730 [Thermoanaerobaculia bacterium]